MRRFGLYITSALFLLTGITHFAFKQTYMKIVPPHIPRPEAAVIISGIAELAGALGLLNRITRSAAGWGLAALLIAVFPANVYMATDRIQVTKEPIPNWLLWLRLPLQPLLIWFVLWVRNKGAAFGTSLSSADQKV